VDKERFSEAEYVRFGERLEESLVALRELLARPRFGEGAQSIGAELELFLVTPDGLPLKRNKAVREAAGDHRVILELGTYNIEVNLTPQALAGRPFAALAEELRDVLGVVDRAAATEGGHAVPIGILPTLREFDFTRETISDEGRYRALSHGMRRLRAEPYNVTILGTERLDLEVEDVILESANTAWQVHLRTTPADFARVHNAAQVAIAPVLAVSGNSPSFLGRELWEETRIALFEQSADDRDQERRWRRYGDGRAAFGSGWVERVEERFEWCVHEYEPVLPVLTDESPLDVVRRGGLPQLTELRMQQGTVWQWNRPVYDPADGGHLRVEMRALPSGPTVPDMTANAAFLLGLVLGMTGEEDGLVGPVEGPVEGFPFAEAYRNFYRAARDGLNARLAWPGKAEAVPADRLVTALLPVAQAGLERAGVDPSDAAAALEVIERRAVLRRTGSSWQREALAALGDGPDGWARMVTRYRELVFTHQPVHTWPNPQRP
jgi:gamma-glutamyl:cysteine ligase YbdK (ATP-grasp superfamily)